ncbi:DUF4265 domain-containing protein [Flavobacterium dauae]|uniref:DUF4265 domain-containing protein n=1 Tax=Flavobacterium dauae TaxID=1563479 RepID=UPI00101B4986|nr:DUF4265 domain-containing protein [Flavobacterium dauae]WLD24423.1 DUF4265 domain-containing protein [Flavobacterium dauae]
MKDENSLQKIKFRYFSDVLEEETVETMWAEIIDEKKGIYKLDNIPFYGASIASDDIFYAEYDEDEESLIFKEIIKSSGNSVVQVVIMKDDYDKEILRKKLMNLGCNSEGVNDKYFVIEIPKKINYQLIKTFLDKDEKDKIIGYAEPILSIKHQDDISLEY